MHIISALSDKLSPTLGRGCSHGSQCPPSLSPSNLTRMTLTMAGLAVGTMPGGKGVKCWWVCWWVCWCWWLCWWNWKASGRMAAAPMSAPPWAVRKRELRSWRISSCSGEVEEQVTRQQVAWGAEPATKGSKRGKDSTLTHPKSPHPYNSLEPHSPALQKLPVFLEVLL